jgi:hypothetical protein
MLGDEIRRRMAREEWRSARGKIRLGCVPEMARQMFRRPRAGRPLRVRSSHGLARPAESRTGSCSDREKAFRRPER